MWRSTAAALLLLAASAAANAGTVCTIVADAADGRILLEDGDCRSRVTPASTFKIPLALMGFDSGFLSSPQAPVLPFREGYPAWGGGDWTRPTDPGRWMRFSVVWYSQQIARQLGADRLRGYAEAFGYGNADISGDPGRNNGLERAWISSSLTISPAEQVVFLRKLVNGTLPVGAQATAMTRRIVETFPAPDGWTIQGKTGGAYPRRADGTFDRARGWGWFVGWAAKEGRMLVFARLAQDDRRIPGSPGIRARGALIGEWPAVVDALAP